MTSERSPVELDYLIGERIRTRRAKLALSQQALAQKLGITFQQIQKYERGANRVASSRLVEIASALETPVDYFLTGKDRGEGGEAPSWPGNWRQVMSSADGAILASLFCQISASERRNIIKYARAMAQTERAPAKRRAKTPARSSQKASRRSKRV